MLTSGQRDQELTMIFYRSTHAPRDLSLHWVRTLSAISLLAYPAGALTLALGPDTAGAAIIGYGLILLALVSYAPLTGSSIQRIVGEEVKRLDEFELRLRGRALSLSYAIFTGLALLVVLYAAIASDKGGWFPASYEEFNGVFWGVFLYASVLPTATLSWMVEPSFSGE
jgi:hypothetical protein